MELQAPSRWRCIDVISDLHLQASEPLTLEAWSKYLRCTRADAVFILGDLFEVWIGDDILTAPDADFEHQCVEMLRSAAARMDIYIMQGNRDFLMGPALMQAGHCTLLEDPTVVVFGQQRWLLTHGDSLCLDDTEYLQFRAQVRGPQWQQDFLDKPLSERMALARQMRAQSEARKRSGAFYADVNTSAALACLQAMHADHMVHGHTHRPGTHLMAVGHERIVLSDWDLGATPARAEVLRLQLQGQGPSASVTVQRISPAMGAGATATTPAG